MQKGNNNKNLQVMFFGGVDGIGKNITALKYGDDILVIDCGVGFPDEDMPGVDLVIPDMTYLKQHSKQIKGIVITHAHEDHIGSLPYLLDTVKAPVYASKLTIAMIENKLREHPRAKMKSVAVNPHAVVRIGCFTVEFINVNHSVAGAYALAITTPVGVVFHSGDFKIDFTPLAGETTDLARMGELGQKGVLLMLCESTNVERPGFTMSERIVGETLEKIFADNDKKRIIITAFASNVHRVQQMMDLAKKYRRKVAFAGRSMINNMEVAMKIGEIRYDKDLIIDIDRCKNYADNEILILATGSQGQESTALSRMANGEFTGVTIGANDTIVFSSSPVPGNEKPVNDMINELMKKNATVIYDDLADVHASGHACRDEIMTVHKLLKPKFLIPVHGEYKHLKAHKELAMRMGMKDNHCIIPDIGMVVEVNKNLFRRAPFDVPAGSRLIDGDSVGDTESVVLKDRKQLAEDGVCIVVMTINKKDGKITSGPEMIPRGFAYHNEVNALMEEGKKAVLQSLNNPAVFKEDWGTIKASVRKTLTNVFYRKTKRKPVIIPVLIED
ncbi:MAG: ribonuclease J [Clostridia bacterium]|nr:ribonuclease J [Clostridia bacterium]